MDSTRKAMEKLLAEVEQSQTQSQEGTETTATTPTETTTISGPNTPSQHSPDALSGASSNNSIGSRFHIDGQPILAPLMTETKRSDLQLSKHMALQLEKKLETVRVPGGQEDSENIGNAYTPMGARRVVPLLQQTKTYIFDQPPSTIKMPQRPQSLGIEVTDAEDTKDAKIPTILVNPPTPQQQELQPGDLTSLGCSVLTVHNRRLNNITNRILHFERSGLGKMLPSTSTEPATVIWHGQDMEYDTSAKPSLTQTLSSLTIKLNNERAGAGRCTVQRSRSFTLEEPSQVLVEHMQRTADAEARALAHFQRETVESKAKRVSRSPKSRNSIPSRGCLRMRPVSPNKQEQPPRQVMEMLLQDQPNLDQEIDLMIERTLNDHKVAANNVDWLRNYLRTHRDRFNQLVQYQHDERLRMQEEFERQQKFLINQICAEVDLSVYRDGLSKQVTVYTSTQSLQQHLASSSQGDELISSSMATTSGATCTSPSNTITISPTVLSPRTPDDSYGSVPMVDICIPNLPPPQHSSRKCLFGTGEGLPKSVSLSSDYEPQPLSGTSAPSTPRSGEMPLRNSNLSNSKRPAVSALAPRTRTASNAQKSNNGRASLGPGSTKGLVQRVVGGGGGSVGRAGPKKTPPGSGNGAATRTHSTARRLPSRALPQGQQQGSASTARKTTSTPTRGRNEEEETAAASRITAGVRGYLVRRLFRTEQVQRVVQTIRDTLIFVLNLHLETYGTSLDEEEEPGNIRLKARLLQQLCSASRTLHLIFFQTSVKERMEIISRDRKRIRTKLLAMHLKQR
ncbi:uncharacterized protein LOC108157696 isoform X1 [Drosophila miranda]|uniref:uncharacterized protein LOC108157696 isoform X1 n=1 Tax=Drosophila miranda TaxID=7229 RepID=UPI0007E746BC|nr:uncharacterized protein LOC108157696 isoform X1 [Drosophila miranda]